MGKAARVKQERAAEQIARAEKAAEERRKTRGRRIATTAVIAALAVFCAAAVTAVYLYKIWEKDGTLERRETAVSVPGYTVSKAMMSALLYMDYYTFVNQNSEQLDSIGLNTEQSLKEQTSSSGEGTWFDYFREQAQTKIKTILPFAAAAKADGMTLSDTDTATIDKAFTSLQENAEAAGKTLDEYLPSLYGKGVTGAVLRETMELSSLAQAYYTAFMEDLSFSDADMADYYTEHAQTYSFCNYRSYLFSVSTPDDATPADIAVAQEKNAAAAEAFAKEAKASGFAAALAQLYGADTADKTVAEKYTNSLTENFSYAGDALSEWAFDAARQKGDVTTLENTGGSLTVYQLETVAHRDESTTRSVRHILLTADTYGSDAKAKERASELLAQWKTDGATEDAFAALATANTEDTASAESGGLYENIQTGQMVEPFENWCFDAARKPGDTGLVKTTYGYHVMYFCSTGLPAWQRSVQEDMKDAAYTDKVEALEKVYPVTLEETALAALTGIETDSAGTAA